MQIEVWNGDIERAIKLFQKGMVKSGLLKELKIRRAYEKPSDKKKRKRREAARRQRKEERRRG